MMTSSKNVNETVDQLLLNPLIWLPLNLAISYVKLFWRPLFWRLQTSQKCAEL